MLKNGQIYFKNLAVITLQDFYSMFEDLRMNGLKENSKLLRKSLSKRSSSVSKKLKYWEEFLWRIIYFPTQNWIRKQMTHAKPIVRNGVTAPFFKALNDILFSSPKAILRQSIHHPHLIHQSPLYHDTEDIQQPTTTI